MGLREWIIGIAAVVMLAVVVDAFRRIMRQRRGRDRLSASRRRFSAGQIRGDNTLYQSPVEPAGPTAQPLPLAAAILDDELPEAEEFRPVLDLAEADGLRIPMLLDAVQPEPNPTQPDPSPRSDQYALNLPEAASTEPLQWPQWDQPLIIDGVDGTHDRQELEPAPSPDADPHAELSWDEPTETLHTPQDAALSDQLLAEPEEVLVLTVLASIEEPFDGPSLLQLMLACGLRFGNMNIFHASDAHGALQYSVANAFKPGTFALDAIAQLTTRGVTFFLQLPCQAEPLEALSAMQHSATLLADTLGGTLLDDQRNIMTLQTMAQYHERVRAFQRAQLLQRK